MTIKKAKNKGPTKPRAPQPTVVMKTQFTPTTQFLLIAGIGIVLLVAIAFIAFPAPAPSSHIVSAVCGDLTCSPTESCISCPIDCGDCGEVCGDSKCRGEENCENCPEDCGTCPKKEVAVIVEKKAEVKEDPLAARKMDNNIYSVASSTNLAPGLETGEELINDSYVIVRYFYDKSCMSCTMPENLKDMVDSVVGDMNGIAVAIDYDLTTYKDPGRQFLNVDGMGIPQNPNIRIDGAPGGERSYKLFRSYSLAQWGNKSEELRKEICSMTDITPCE